MLASVNQIRKQKERKSPQPNSNLAWIWASRRRPCALPEARTKATVPDLPLVHSSLPNDFLGRKSVNKQASGHLRFSSVL